MAALIAPARGRDHTKVAGKTADKIPEKCILVANDFPPAVKKATEHINKLKDLKGNSYKFEAQKLSGNN